MVKVRTYFLGGDGGSGNQKQTPALSVAVGPSRAENRGAGFLRGSPTLTLRFCPPQLYNIGVFLASALQVFLPRLTTLPRTCNKNRWKEHISVFQPAASEQELSLYNEHTDHTCSNVRPNFISAYIASVATQRPLKGTRPILPKSPTNMIHG